jgi:hypothetical protein
LRRRASTDDIRRPAPPAAILSRQLGSIITIMRIGSQAFHSKDGPLTAAETIGLPCFVAGPDRRRSTLQSPRIAVVSSTPTRSRRFADSVRRRRRTIDGLALMEWANARLGKAPRLSHPGILDRPVCSPIAAAAQIYMRRNESQRRPNAAHKRYRDIPSCATESADMRRRLEGDLRGTRR